MRLHCHLLHFLMYTPVTTNIISQVGRVQSQSSFQLIIYSQWPIIEDDFKASVKILYDESLEEIKSWKALDLGNHEAVVRNLPNVKIILNQSGADNVSQSSFQHIVNMNRFSDLKSFILVFPNKLSDEDIKAIVKKDTTDLLYIKNTLDSFNLKLI